MNQTVTITLSLHKLYIFSLFCIIVIITTIGLSIQIYILEQKNKKVYNDYKALKIELALQATTLNIYQSALHLCTNNVNTYMKIVTVLTEEINTFCRKNIIKK